MADVAFLADTPTLLEGAQPRSRIPVAMLGRFKDRRYGAFTIEQRHLDNWRKLLSDHFHGRVPIDEDHKTDKGVSSEASGWITSLSDPDAQNIVWADVEWTPKGEAAVREKRYLYISPTFVDAVKNDKGDDLGPALLRAALTNSPFLHRMPAITLSQAPPEFAEAEPAGADSRGAMPLTDIAKALGLDDSADEAKILEAIQARPTPEHVEGTKTLEQLAADSGKVLLTAEQLTDLTAKAAAGEAAAKKLETNEFDGAYKKALDEGRIDATDETKQLYADLPTETAVKLLDSLKPIVSTRPRGQGGHDAEVPTGHDEESFRLNAKVEARMAEKGETFPVALEAVTAEHELQEA